MYQELGSFKYQVPGTWLLLVSRYQELGSTILVPETWLFQYSDTRYLAPPVFKHLTHAGNTHTGDKNAGIACMVT